MRIEAYYNLHKKCLSYRPIGGRVQHANMLLLKNVKFAVQPAGREKVLREKRKNVHAFVRGDLQPFEDAVVAGWDSDWHHVYYNPYKHETFVRFANLEPIFEADECLIIDNMIYIR